MSSDVANVKRETMPRFMRGQTEEDLGTKDLARHVVPPRLKIIQTNARAPFNAFRPGDIVIVPTMEVLAPVDLDGQGKPLETGAEFSFVPVFHFDEWVLWNPLELKGQLPAVRARTLDPQSPIAVKAQNPDKRQEVCPEMTTKMMKYVEHINFLCMISSPGPFQGIVVVTSFARSEHKMGRHLADLLRMRRDPISGDHAPIYGCQFVGQIGPRDNAKGHWLGLNVTNPSDESGVSRFIEEENMYQLLQKQYYEFRDAHKARILQPDYGDDETDLDPVADARGEF